MSHYYISACNECSVLIQGPRVFNIVEANEKNEKFLEIGEIKQKNVVCKGQGTRYAKKPWAAPAKFDRFLFSGIFKGSCCLCALRNSWSILAFHEVACTHCKDGMELLVIFKKGIKRSKSCWSGLSDCMIQMIIACKVTRG